MSKKLCVGVFGSIGNSDLGDDAYVKASIEQLESFYGSIDWCILSGDPKETEARLNKPSIQGFMRPSLYNKKSFDSYYLPFRQMIECIIWALFFFQKNKIPNWFQNNTKNILRTLLNANMIVNFGGGFLNEDYRKAFISEIVFLWLCERIAKPVVLLAQSLGPFYNKIFKNLATNALNRCQVLTIREPNSFELCQTLGLTRPKIEITADSAVLLNNISENKTNDFAIKYNIPHNVNVIGFSVRQWKYPGAKNPAEKHFHYVSTVAAIADQLANSLNCYVFLVPTATRPNDHDVCEEVKDRMANNSKRVIICGDGTDLFLARQAISMCDLFIATRLHPLIFATSAGIPSVAISYTPKVAGYMQMIEQEDLVCEIDNVDEEAILKMCQKIWQRREAEKKHLQRIIAKLRKKAERNIELLHELIKNTDVN